MEFCLQKSLTNFHRISLARCIFSLHLAHENILLRELHMCHNQWRNFSQVVACLRTFCILHSVDGIEVASYFIPFIVSVFVKHILVWLLEVTAAGNLHL